jgi:hypothetical protein
MAVDSLLRCGVLSFHLSTSLCISPIALSVVLSCIHLGRKEGKHSWNRAYTLISWFEVKQQQLSRAFSYSLALCCGGDCCLFYLLPLAFSLSLCVLSCRFFFSGVYFFVLCALLAAHFTTPSLFPANIYIYLCVLKLRAEGVRGGECHLPSVQRVDKKRCYSSCFACLVSLCHDNGRDFHCFCVTKKRPQWLSVCCVIGVVRLLIAVLSATDRCWHADGMPPSGAVLPRPRRLPQPALVRQIHPSPALIPPRPSPTSVVAAVAATPTTRRLQRRWRR